MARLQAHDETMNELGYQDIMAIETQGPIAPRRDWHPGTADRGIVMFERMLLREMERVQQGLDPIAVIRDPGQVIDTSYEFFRQHWTERLTQVVPAGVPMYARPGTQRGLAVAGAPA